MTAELAGVYLWSGLGGLIAYVYNSLTLMGIFRKAGLEVWPAWVPFFNVWRLLQLGGRKGAWVLASLVPVIGTIVYLVVLISAGWKIQNAFGKSPGFFVLAILLTPVWYGILAWDSSVWRPQHAPIVPASGYARSTPAR